MAFPSTRVSLSIDFSQIQNLRQTGGVSTTNSNSTYLVDEKENKQVKVGSLSLGNNFSVSENSSRQVVTITCEIPDDVDLNSTKEEETQVNPLQINVPLAAKVNHVARQPIHSHKCSRKTCLKIFCATLLNIANIAWVSAVIYYFREDKELYSSLGFGIAGSLPINGLFDYYLIKRSSCSQRNQN
jgi:hypothetical protein